MQEDSAGVSWARPGRRACWETLGRSGVGRTVNKVRTSPQGSRKGGMEKGLGLATREEGKLLRHPWKGVQDGAGDVSLWGTEGQSPPTKQDDTVAIPSRKKQKTKKMQRRRQSFTGTLKGIL